MPPTRPPYPLELKRQIVELVRAGRSPAELARFPEMEVWAISLICEGTSQLLS